MASHVRHLLARWHRLGSVDRETRGERYRIDPAVIERRVQRTNFPVSVSGGLAVVSENNAGFLGRDLSLAYTTIAGKSDHRALSGEWTANPGSNVSSPSTRISEITH